MQFAMELDMDGTMNITAMKRKRAGIYMCVGCGSQIQDQYILRVAPDLEWHATCLRCADCNQYLDESCTCFVRDGKTYCKQDYVRLFGTKCAKCFGAFTRNDFVMRAKNKIFHIDCFRCTSCCRQLVPGDEFTIRDDRLFCKADGDLADQCIDKDDKMSVSSFENEKKPNVHGREGHTGSSARKNKEHKTTRVRTVLNEKQLHTLRTCYGANPRPDALMKEQLVEMTNLSPRVIRVWFQNKRCKDKKRMQMLKQLQEQQEKAGSRLQGQINGVPMVATSPVRHDGLQAQAVDIQQYQAPWKALSEFAMQAEMEQPPFQQLVNSFVETSDDDDSVMSGDMCPSRDQVSIRPA